MTRLILAAGVAALAISAPAASQPGDRDKDRRAEVQKKRSDARAQRAERREQRAQRVERRAPRVDRAERRQTVERRAQRSEARAQRAERSQAVERRAQRVDRAERRQAVERRAQRVDRAERRQAVERRAQRVDRAERVNRVREQRAQRVDRVREQRADRVERVREQRVAAKRVNQRLERVAERNREFGWIDRREQRLADRRIRQLDRIDRRQARAELRAFNNVQVIPVVQASTFLGEPITVVRQQVVFRDVPDRLRFIYADTPDYYYRYGSGYMYRVNRESQLISALLPLFGLGLMSGQQFPMAYSNYYLPTGLQPFYPSYANSQCGSSPFGYSPYGYSSFQDDYYRYANGYVYEIDCRTGLIEDIDPMLGYGYGYGQMMPAHYSTYNVPYQYRPLYYDTANYHYRYAPGAIYQVDPTTSLITAVAALLTGGMTVGQPMPLGYGAYNVPYGYRTTYYDTPDAWYRYSNGHIYRIDPTTQLVTAMVAAALT